ncbi:hypothetical protein TRFO_26356 [Tritrichomonas foetus]|uniref:Uncharacterized protein n=1 Tax=Tritrichomonas foetus TaxID=1144522 RepID=A0A1J4K4Q5_9EUKA|nr:hypothetical protein TRFO_26356 [Tritrichomonas foetus]|eukprot:OHT05840.1 hypothetical protein TRFO_26356 [Tritrichomonas foetus]
MIHTNYFTSQKTDFDEVLYEYNSHSEQDNSNFNENNSQSDLDAKSRFLKKDIESSITAQPISFKVEFPREKGFKRDELINESAIDAIESHSDIHLIS